MGGTRCLETRLPECERIHIQSKHERTHHYVTTRSHICGKAPPTAPIWLETQPSDNQHRPLDGPGKIHPERHPPYREREMVMATRNAGRRTPNKKTGCERHNPPDGHGKLENR